MSRDVSFTFLPRNFENTLLSGYKLAKYPKSGGTICIRENYHVYVDTYNKGTPGIRVLPEDDLA